jgi:hypothetical protein
MPHLIEGLGNVDGKLNDISSAAGLENREYGRRDPSR